MQKKLTHPAPHQRTHALSFPGHLSQRWPNINPFKPEFTIVIFIHYKPRIAVAILDL